jgi:hypothetical protein
MQAYSTGMAPPSAKAAEVSAGGGVEVPVVGSAGREVVPADVPGGVAGVVLLHAVAQASGPVASAAAPATMRNLRCRQAPGTWRAIRAA